ncbi:MAG: iron-hydrogenase subunit gamma [Bacillota bacterium]|nr:iron-hydrogenase subunit gamma [Bacillota bacterium]MDK2855621.1 iron-hydrogenase subunit gamma [Bacillota bacterium]MDK2926215.1 iron-hydrogenase subunit gamma [Bacillota bacterium]
MFDDNITSGRRFAAVNEIVEKHGRRPEHLVAILQEVQEVYRYLPEEVLTYVATSLGLSPAKVFGVATFYENFSLEPKGKYVIRVCDGTACHVRGSALIQAAVRERLGLKEGQKTTSDLLFTLETVACLGACALAPVVTINGDVHGQATPEKIVALIDELAKGERKS